MTLKGTIKGLSAIKGKAESKGGNFEDGESPFLTIKDGESYKIRFLQEIDDESPLYDERRGAIAVVEEHTSPKDFKIRAVCTHEADGKCWACEQTQAVSDEKIARKWRPRMRFYALVLVRNEDGPDKVKILAQGFSDKNVGSDIINIAEEFGQLGDRDMKISRKGSGMNDTSYSLLPLAEKPLTDEEKELDLIDISKFISYVEYDKQAAFYSGKEDEGGDPDEWDDED